MKGVAAPGLLDSYEAERRPAGKSIVDRAVRVAFTDEMDMEDEKLQFLTDMQMTLTYAGSPLVGELVEDSGAFDGGPAPGDRAPDVEHLRRFGVSHPVRLFELTRGTAHTLLAYVDTSTKEHEVVGFEKLADKVRGQGAGLLNVYVIAHPDATVPPQLDLPVLRDTADALPSTLRHPRRQRLSHPPRRARGVQVRTRLRGGDRRTSVQTVHYLMVPNGCTAEHLPRAFR